MYKHKCHFCGIEFNHKDKKREYCSINCYRKSQRDNAIEVKENHAEIIINSKKYGTQTVLIDKEDIQKVSQFQWAIDKVGENKFYISTNLYNQHPRKLYLHRFITNCPTGKCVDHINHNRFDNRKINLKICTIAENNNNFSLSKANTSGHKHICFDKRNNKFCLSIKGTFYGRFKTIEEALKKKEGILCHLELQPTQSTLPTQQSHPD